MTFTTFGFEAEFAHNAEPLVRRLHNMGLCSSDSLHRYHCGCRECEFGNDTYPLRAQRDSTVAGEIISDIYGGGQTPYDMEDFVLHARGIQEAAVQVDAEPGLNAGVHVHVMPTFSSAEESFAALMAFYKWEDTAVALLSPGRFPSIRSMNQRFAARFRDMARAYFTVDVNYPFEVEGLSRETKDNIVYQWRHMDRHTNLNTGSGHGTWEFRLWNSTRSAWRLEMYVRASLAFIHPDFIAASTDISPSADTLLSAFAAVDDGLAELASRQIHYNRRANIDRLGPFTAYAALD